MAPQILAQSWTCAVPVDGGAAMRVCHLAVMMPPRHLLLRLMNDTQDEVSLRRPIWKTCQFAEVGSGTNLCVVGGVSVVSWHLGKREPETAYLEHPIF
jgi:hypothetical protein